MGPCPRLVLFLVFVHFLVFVFIHSFAEATNIVGEGKHEILLKDVRLNVFDKGFRDISTDVGILVE